MRKPFAYAGLLIGLSGLILQFIISMSAYADQGLDPAFSIIRFFSYFTILTNILLVLVYAGAVVRGQAWLSFFRRPVTRATAAASIILVGAFYHLFLAGIWDPQGLFWLCDFLLHTVTPVIFVIWYAIWNRTGTLRWRQLPTMLVYPVAYVIWVMIRGPFAGEYPYPSLDVDVLGYGTVAFNIAMLLIAYLLLSAIMILIDRAVAVGSTR
jgi:hypothetical protein